LDEVLEEREEYADKLAELFRENENLRQQNGRLNELHRENENLRQQNGRLEELEKWLRGEIELKMRRIRESQTNLEKANEKIAEDEKLISELEKDLSSLRTRYDSTMKGLAEIARLIK
jgi:chromosome segregation ATPase